MNLTSFLQEIENLKSQLSIPAQEYLEGLKSNPNEIMGSIKITDNGIKILKSMQDNNDKYMNIFKSKELGELLFMAPRSVSGSMKKLIADGLVEKVGVNPVAYSLTDLGKALKFDKE